MTGMEATQRPSKGRLPPRLGYSPHRRETHKYNVRYIYEGAQAAFVFPDIPPFVVLHQGFS